MYTINTIKEATSKPRPFQCPSPTIYKYPTVKWCSVEADKLILH